MLEHPKPYHISWIKDEHTLLVSEQCYVNLKIGKYYDKVLCDIMPMDCCHILLGRPWQYDRHAIYDGRLHKYTIMVDGRKQILLPLMEEPISNVCTFVKVCLMEGRKFVKDLKKNDVCFTMIPNKPSKKIEDNVPEEIDKLLNEYSDIISNNVPDGLPPKRSIDHCMNLIPGASLLNKAPHRLTPTENQELN